MSRICTIDGCGKPRVGFGYCTAHYRRNKRHGHPLGGGITPGTVAQYFEGTVLPYVGGDCLIWPFSKDAGGYARMIYKGRNVGVTRTVCEIFNGPPPTPQHQAAHSCGKGMSGCVTPGHLRWATPVENSADKFLHGTVLRGEDCTQSKLTDDAVEQIRALTGAMSHRKTARLFGVSAVTVRDVRKGKRWAHTFSNPKQESV